MRLCLWAEHASRFPANTGIQRVTRCLARALSDAGHEVIPVKWAVDGFTFEPLSKEECQHLARWNGPREGERSSDLQLPSGGWLLVPELVSEPHRPSLKSLIRAARMNGWRTAVVFYDAIPHKLASLYPPRASKVHREYMRSLASADVVIPISRASGRDLLDYWMETGACKAEEAESKVKPCQLAGEFPETPRVSGPSALAGAGVTALSVGTVEPRKNHLMLVRSFICAARERPDLGLRLIIAGTCSYPDLGKEVRSLIASHKDVNIRWKSRVDDRFLSQLYAESDFTVFPSLAEGFGLPIVESLWHGRPVICHNEGAIRETASGGGCLLADMNSEKDLSAKILRLGGDRELREELTRQAISAPVKTWIDYAGEVASVLRDADEKSRPPLASLPKPLLSICVTTYNRAGWLAHSLPLILEQTKPYQDAVEVVVCDNASQDETPNVVTGFGHYANLRFHRNEKNVGMLGNLAVSSNQGRGRYVWVIGDDDLMIEGAIERVLTAVTRHPETELIYMNYAFTRFDRPQDLIDTRQVIRTARPISANFKDEFSTKISSIAAKTENCFTAIYCLIYRADHAKLAYNQDTSGAPFSTLKTCVPTADYVCRNMFDRPGYWIGDPCMVVNLNVSWMSYASLYILERFPELYDLMRERGADSAQVDRIQAGQLPGVMAWLESIYLGSQRENLPHFSMKRLIDRFARLPEFRRQWGTYFNVYLRAFQKGLTEDASLTPKDVQDYYAKKVQEIVP